MPLFKRKTEDTLETVRTRLTAASNTLAALEAELRERSLEAALSDDPGEALGPMSEKVAKARATVEALSLAEAEAQRIDKKQRQMAADDQEKSRRRAAGQHRGEAKRAAVRLREGLESAVAAYDELVSAAERVERLLAPGERAQLIGPGGLRSALNELVRTAMGRANSYRGSARPIDRFPLVPQMLSVPHGAHVTELPPLEDAVGARLDLAELHKSGFVSPSDLRPPNGRGPVAQVPAPRADAPPRFDEVELPEAVAKGLQVISDVIADPSAHSAEELAAAREAVGSY